MVCLLAIALLTDRFFKRPFALPGSVSNRPWPVQLGLRVATLRAQVPTVDQVVVVPDSATFLAAIQQWSLKGRWPILIDDSKYTPLFIQRFQPAEVIRLPSVKQALPQGKALRELMQQAVASAWDATDLQSLKETWLQLGWEPPGVVITSETDPAWPAAVALASDRGQPLVFLDKDFGKPNDTLQQAQWQELATSVREAVKTTGYFYANLGDAIDTVTLVRQLAAKYESPQKKDEQLATTDGLGRFPNGKRWALVGWIFGSSSRSAYQAMCSIFLDFKTAMLYDSYSPEGNWKKYEMNTAAEELGKMGFQQVDVVEKPEASLKRWRSLVTQPWDFDLILINSKGTPRQFQVGDGDAIVKDIPQLRSPAVVHLIHSWSAAFPDDLNTVAGRWLDNGAYFYVGSVHEPYLGAFIPPKIIAERLSLSAPFITAVRHLELKPWKVTTIGDPLTAIAQPRRRVPPHK